MGSVPVGEPCRALGDPQHGQKSFAEGSQWIIQRVAPALGSLADLWAQAALGLFVVRLSAQGRLLLESCSVYPSPAPVQADRCLLSWILREKTQKSLCLLRP